MSNTKIYKHYSNGWTAETTYKEPAGQYSWRITTLKRSSGKIASYAQAVEFDENGNLFWDMFLAPNIDLITSTGKATENTIRDQHYKAIAIFDQMEQAGELPEKEAPKNDSDAFNPNDHGMTWGEGDGDSHIGDTWKENLNKPAAEPEETPLGKLDPQFFEQHHLKIKGSVMSDPKLMEGYNFVMGATNGGKDWTEYQNDPFTRNLIRTFFLNAEPIVRKSKPYLFEEPDGGYTGYRWEGSAYKNIRGLATKDIAALAREEYKATFPDMKWSVTTDVYSGGASIRAEGKNYPYNPYTDEFLKLAEELGGFYPARNDARYKHSYKEIFNQRYLKDEKKAKEILSQYRYSDSDGMIDYFSTNFYDHVSIDLKDWDAKLFPDRAKEIGEHASWGKEWDEKSKKASENAKKLIEEKGIMPKWTIGTYTTNLRGLGDTTMPAVIYKSPNGRSRYSLSYGIYILPPAHPKPGYRYLTSLNPVSHTSVKFDEKAAKLSWPQYLKQALKIAGLKEDGDSAKRYEKAIKKAWQYAQKRAGVSAEPKKAPVSKPAAKASQPTVSADQVTFEVIAGQHTKTGANIWTVKINGRVDSETFNKLRQKAKENGGYYSSYRGNGAVPGFIFKSESSASWFAGVEAKEVKKPTTEDSKAANLAGKWMLVHFMGVEEPKYVRILDAKVTDKRYSQRQVIITTKNGAITSFDLKHLNDFIAGKAIDITQGTKEKYAIQLDKQANEQTKPTPDTEKQRAKALALALILKYKYQ